MTSYDCAKPPAPTCMHNVSGGPRYCLHCMREEVENLKARISRESPEGTHSVLTFNLPDGNGRGQVVIPNRMTSSDWGDVCSQIQMLIDRAKAGL